MKDQKLVKINIELEAMQMGIRQMVMQNAENLNAAIDTEIDRALSGEQVIRQIEREVDAAITKAVGEYLSYGEGRSTITDFIQKKLEAAIKKLD